MGLHAHQIEPGLWSATALDPDVSYPVTGHRNLAAIEDESYWFRHRAEIVTGWLSRNPPNGCLFDVGGGNGFMVRAIRDAGYPAVLLEPGTDGCRVALSRGLAPVLNGTTRTLAVPSSSLPSVGLFDVIEHVANDREFLRHIFDLLVPGGRLYMLVPAHQGLWSTNDEVAGHFRRYSRREIVRELGEAGFEPVYSTYLFRALVLPVLILRALPFRVGIRESRATTTDAHLLPDGPIGRAISKTFESESRKINEERTLGTGTSVFIVSAKPG